MGNLSGHVLPGCFLLTFGVWWLVQILRRYFTATIRRGPPYRSCATFPPEIRGCSLDMVGLLMILCCSFGVAIEMGMKHVFGIYTTTGAVNFQHATMYFAFALAGLCAVLLPRIKRFLPDVEDVIYLMLAMAFVVESILFKFHLFGRDKLDYIVHILLFYTSCTSALMTLLEMRYKDSVLVALTRGYSVILQGTWFFQIGFALYNPLPGDHFWDPENDDHIMMVACFYGWHMAGVAIFVLLVSLAVAYYIQRRHARYPESDPLLSKGDGYHPLQPTVDTTEVSLDEIEDLQEMD